MTTVQSRTTLAINSITSRKIRVNIVEDQALFRDLLRTALGGYGQIEVVTTADNGSDGIKNAYQYRPDAVIMDVDLGEGMTGIEAAQKIKSLRPETGIVILSSHRDKEYLQSVAEGRGGGQLRVRPGVSSRWTPRSSNCCALEAHPCLRS
jgi:CheY-like chemotaxis protein